MKYPCDDDTCRICAGVTESLRFEATETARLAARDRDNLTLIADLTAQNQLLRMPLEPDIDNGRRLHRMLRCPNCAHTGPHYLVTTIGHWAELRCGFHGCRHRWEHNTKEPT